MGKSKDRIFIVVMIPRENLNNMFELPLIFAKRNFSSYHSKKTLYIYMFFISWTHCNFHARHYSSFYTFWLFVQDNLHLYLFIYLMLVLWCCWWHLLIDVSCCLQHTLRRVHATF